MPFQIIPEIYKAPSSVKLTLWNYLKTKIISVLETFYEQYKIFYFSIFKFWNLRNKFSDNLSLINIQRWVLNKIGCTDHDANIFCYSKVCDWHYCILSLSSVKIYLITFGLRVLPHPLLMGQSRLLCSFCFYTKTNKREF